MNDLHIKSVDTGGLTMFMKNMADMFYSRGADETIIQKFVEVETGQLAAQISDNLGPKSFQRAKAGAESNVSSFLNPQDSKFRSFSTDRQKNSRYNGFEWLFAGPNFLLGIKKEDNQVGSDGIQLMRKGQSNGARGKSYVRIGTHLTPKGKHQAIIWLNRARVSKSSFASTKQYIFDRIGEAKASFASTALKLLSRKSFPGYVSNKIEQVESKDKVIYDASSIGSSTNPEITFGASAPGMLSNQSMVSAIDSAILTREAKSEKKLEQLIKGAAYNLNTGQVYKPSSESMEDEI